MKKVLAITALVGVAGAATLAEAAPQPATLLSVKSYSNNGFSSFNLSASTATWTFDTVTGTAAIASGTYYGEVLSPNVFGHTMAGVSLGNFIPSLGTFACNEGTFGSAVGASLCGNYNFGSNKKNQSTYTPTAQGGTVDINSTVGGDDAALGAPQSLQTSYSNMVLFTTGLPANQYIISNAPSPNSTASKSGYDFVFSVSDITPDAFTFTAQTDVALSTSVTSNAVVIAGIDGPSPISITGGEYAVGAGAFTAAAGTVSAGNSVTVRQTSSATPSTLTTATLTIGGVDGAFDVTTEAADTIPTAFTFTAQTNVALGTPTTSNAITVAGINVPSPISIVGGEYAIGAGAFTAAPGTVSSGNSVTVRQTSSATPSTLTTATLTIGGVDGAFDVTTEVADTTPTAFTFTAQTDVPLSTTVSSNAITVAGINVPSPISIVGGEYAIGAGAFTSAPGTVSAGNSVTVRQTSSASFDTPTTATLTIGGVDGAFTVTTEQDVPDEVVVIDGGSSAVDPWSLAFLGGLPLLRRRRKAALKAAAAATVAAASVLAAPNASAADTDRWDWNYEGLYLGAGVNGTSLQTRDSVTSELGDILGLESGGGNFEDFPVGGQVYAGWMFNRHWGLEGRWSGTDDGESNILVEDVITGDRTKIGDAEVSLDGWTVYGVGNWPVAQRWDLFGKLGYTWQDADVKLTVDGAEGGSASNTTNDNGFAAAVGARWRFARHWAATVEGEYLDVNFDDSLDEPWRASLNVEYWFGGHEIAPPPPPPAKVVAAPPPPPPAAPMDSDGDGVVDGTDQCPDTPKGDRVGPAGCSCDVTRQLQFKLNSAELSDSDKLILDEMAENLTRLKFVSGTIVGYTDSTGSEAYNQGLSERRAKSVAKYLEGKGIAADRMQIEGKGEADPIADNKTAEGRAMNRRVVAKRTDCDK